MALSATKLSPRTISAKGSDPSQKLAWSLVSGKGADVRKRAPLNLVISKEPADQWERCACALSSLNVIYF